ncbi:hypothetical protein KVT40_002094 [Elsinoe batatas]|uniref:Uncharacterized protein n=1 Tax=Elsinoe batatas TaxID=2601811 RepID=A0A8K0LAE8_9PEZI|nr:hypothetical protein KVT40_002094 [Elsinoe batatas]
MDTGHFNCRDYHVTEDLSPGSVAAIIKRRSQSSASPMNKKIERHAPFPFFKLPLEIRQKIYSYFAPRATARDATTIKLPFARNASPPSRFRSRKKPVIWERGQTNLLCLCRQMHDEYAAMLYGDSVFVVFVKYSSITFRYQWQLPSGLTPTSDMEFLESFSGQYLQLVRQVHIIVDHPDSYTGMIKYNVGGNGLTYGLWNQVKKLADVFSSREGSVAGLNVLHVELINGNEYLDCEKRGIVRARERVQGTEDVQHVLEPLRQLRGIADIKVTGAVTSEFADALCKQISRKEAC